MIPAPRPSPSIVPSSVSSETKDKTIFGQEHIAHLRVNDLCVVRLRGDPYQPLAIARLLSRGPDHHLVMQLLGCHNLDYRIEVFVKHKFQNGWYQPSTKQVYYKHGKLHSTHVPLTNDFSQQEILESDIIAFSFGLRNDFKLPPHIQDLIKTKHAELVPTPP